MIDNYTEKPNIEAHESQVNIKKRTATNHIVVHCSATRNKPSIDWKSIDKMHRQRGWLCIGYHFVIKTDGTIQQGRRVDEIGAHVSGHNDDTIGICLIGGYNGKKDFKGEQMEALRSLIAYLRSEYPDADVLGHRDFKGVNKECPCFDVREWFYR